MAQATIDDVEERQALLNQTSDRDYGEAQTTTSEPVMSRKDYVSVAMLFLIYGMVDLSDKLTDLGGNEIIEGIICRMVHGSVDNPLTDPRCKDSTVQAQMSRIIGWVYSIATIPCILTTVTWGLAAEKYGRRPVLMLSVLGLTLCNATMLLICRSRPTKEHQKTTDSLSHLRSIGHLDLLGLGCSFTDSRRRRLQRDDRSDLHNA